jgi:hypothetical protein
MASIQTPVDQLPCTGGTEQLVTLATTAGLRPHVQVDQDGRTIYRGTYTIIVNGTGEHSPFGGIVVGATTGRVLRGSITYGNDGPTRRYRGARQVLAAIRALVRNASPTSSVPRKGNMLR